MNRLTIRHDNCEDNQTDLVIDYFRGTQIDSAPIGQTGVEYIVAVLTPEGKITVGHHGSEDAANAQLDLIWKRYEEITGKPKELSRKIQQDLLEQAFPFDRSPSHDTSIVSQKQT